MSLIQDRSRRAFLRNSSSLLAACPLISRAATPKQTVQIASLSKGQTIWPWRGASIEAFSDEGSERFVDVLADVGANSIEIILNVRHFMRFRAMSFDDAWGHVLDWGDVVLDRCRARNVVGIVSFAQVPSDAAFGFDQYSPRFWMDADLRGKAIDDVRRIVCRYASRGAELAAYEFINEPLVIDPPTQYVPKEWPALLDRIVSSVREIDPDRYIVVTPGPGGEASGYLGFKPLQHSRIIYGVHVYNPHDYSHQRVGGRASEYNYPGVVNSAVWDAGRVRRNLQDVVRFSQEHGAKVWVGEFSAARWAPGSLSWIEDNLNAYEEVGFGWAYFALNSHHAWNPFLGSRFTDDRDQKWRKENLGFAAPRWQLLKRAFETNQKISII